APAPLALLMPVYRGLAETRAAIASALKAKPSEARFIVVDDASPEPDLAAWLADQAGKGRFELIRHPRNLGFCAACNTGFAAAPGCDVLLLNSDILLPAPAVETLRRVAYASPATGTVTPLANDATICAYPAPNTANPMPDLRETTRLNRLAAKTNGLAWVEIPTGIGFCLYIRHDCLAAVGGFRAEIFAQGYGEENDFCLRARQRGFLHAAAMGAYVAHKGGVSFRSAARALVRRNLALLNRLYPGYTALIAAHNAADPAAPHRAALDAARLLAERRGRPAVLLISHAHGGGVATRVRAVMAQLRAQGCYPLLLTARRPAAPERTPYPWPSLLCAGDPEAHPNLVFTLPGGLPRLLALLRRLKVTRVELHHALGQHAAVRGLAAALGVPQDIVAHDYASFCPRVNLLARPAPEAPPRYCGEPDPKGCARCCARDKAEIAETISIPRLLARSRQEFAAARRVITPSADMARRLARHFPGLEPEIIPWEDDSAPRPLRKPRPGARRVAVIGGIGPAKGLDVLLGCAADSRRRDLPLDFTLIGGSADDAALIAAGVKVTGPYQPGEAEALITSLAPDLAFIPSIWPETWCFVLGEAWRAGLYTVVFDLGAQAERVRATGRGAILPLGLPPERVNNSLLNITF
ncbi:glycosyltransferase, partial [Acidocella sp.]|uniref:glycosyltransferase n=1 Tax=Acidocella sp. TaxID=50710 RepID=UPI0026098118